MRWKKNMGSLDMSKFHDVLIEDEDGNIQPKDEPYFKAKLIAPGTWQVLSDGDYTYVIEGDDEIIAIDSGMGAGNIREFCQTLSEKPLYRLLNTHNHFDHTANNFLFDVVYMSQKSYEGRCQAFGGFEGMDIPDDYPRASVSSKGGKPVFARRSPNMEFVVDGLKAAGFEKHLELNGGRGCFCFMRKLTLDGIFDRQIEMDGCRVCYYLNRIWDK